jgi:hypothetical protein
MSVGGSGVGGGGVGEDLPMPLEGICLSVSLWSKYIQISREPAYIEDRRVGHEQAAMLVAAFDQPVKVSICDEYGFTRATSPTVMQIFTRNGGTLIIGDAAIPRLTVVRGGEPNPFWRLNITADDGSMMSGSFGLWKSDATFVWGRTAFKDGQSSFGFKRSLIMTQTVVSVQPPATSGEFLYCNGRIMGYIR